MPKNNEKKHEKELKAPEIPSLGSFLTQHIEEAQTQEAEDTKERLEIRKERETKERLKLSIDAYAPRRREFTKPLKAYRAIEFKNPSVTAIVFAQNVHQARYRGAKFFKEYGYFNSNGRRVDPNIMHSARAYRIPEFDKYALTERVPIPELMKAGFKFSCACCHQYTFDYSAYEARACFIFEEGTNPIPYAEGFVVCHECYKKLGY